MKKYLTTAEAADYLGVSKRTLESYRYKGIGPDYVQKNKFIRYVSDWLDSWAFQGHRKTIDCDGDREQDDKKRPRT